MKKALIVGIDDYPCCSLGGCINDAYAVSKMLEYNEDGSKNFDICLETNIETKGKLTEKVQELFSGTSEVALFYFSGHGYIDEIGGIIVTPDYNKCDMGVFMNTILKLANDSKCKNKVIILDCCYSGDMGRTGFDGTSSTIGEGVTVLTASLPIEAAMEVNGHGVFTNLLLSALSGGAANILGKITPGSIYAYIDQALGAWQQRPVFKTNISKFISIRDVEPRISLRTLKTIVNYFDNSDKEFRLDPSYEFTNNEEAEHKVKEPYANADNVKIFKNLQVFESAGLVEPVGEEHMYFAAMNSKSCKLTTLGQYYWRLVTDKRI
jgi:hypothetical protein